MPVKGDNLSVAIAAANIDNLKNVSVAYTNSLYAYPSAHTATVDAIYSRDSYEVNNYLSFFPVLIIQKGTIIDPFDLATIVPAKGDQATLTEGNFIVEEVEINSDDMYRLILRTKNA